MTTISPWTMPIAQVEITIFAQIPSGWICAELLGRFLGFSSRQNAIRSVENHLVSGEDYRVSLNGTRVSKVWVSVSGAKAWGAIVSSRRKQMSSGEFVRWLESRMV